MLEKFSISGSWIKNIFGVRSANLIYLTWWLKMDKPINWFNSKDPHILTFFLSSRKYKSQTTFMKDYKRPFWCWTFPSPLPSHWARIHLVISTSRIVSEFLQNTLSSLLKIVNFTLKTWTRSMARLFKRKDKFHSTKLLDFKTKQTFTN